MKVCCISDIHMKHDRLQLPEADTLVIAGDFLMKGTVGELYVFCTWLATLPKKFKHKVIVAGNHDICLEDEKTRLEAEAMIGDTGAWYLRDTGITLDGVRFYGSPWQPTFHDWAFNLPRGKPLADKWDMIYPDTQVLITHGPAYGIRDEAPRGGLGWGDVRTENVGCKDLRRKILGSSHEENLIDNSLKLHVFGHIHHSYGVETKRSERRRNEEVIFVNASVCDERYQPVNLPNVIDI